EPDVRFRNDSEAPVIIKHVYDDDTFTVKFYGNNGGRICTEEKGERFNFSGPPVRYEADPTVPPGTQRVASRGSRGWSITVTRVITYPDGTVERQPFTHQYRGELNKILVNPCDMPNTTLECPISVPRVVGQSQDAAAAALAGAGFAVAVTPQEATADQVGIVLSQSPGSGSFLEEGETVTIVVGVDNEPDE
ncbi:MAG: PASTA domain-containing protein, partial [Actinobacteria bacterium]